MASRCSRCALRLQHASHTASRRAFSQSTRRSKQLPSFHETSNEELNSVLATLRTQHVIPNYLSSLQRKKIFSPKLEQFFRENPQTVTIGDDEAELQWIDRNTRPDQQHLLKKALKLILSSKDDSWENVPPLLRAMNEGRGFPIRSRKMEWIVRKAIHHGKLPIVFRCLQQSEATGMSLKNWVVLRSLVLGIRETAQGSGWEKNHIAQALTNFQKVMSLLESEEHGGGFAIKPDDARTKAEVISPVLELAAVYAYKHTGGEDVGGVVKTYAERLLSILEAKSDIYSSDSYINLARKTKNSPFWSYLLAVPTYHGLSLAHKMLGDKTPRVATAEQFIIHFRTRLEGLTAELEVSCQDQHKNTYEWQALRAWQSCIRDQS